MIAKLPLVAVPLPTGLHVKAHGAMLGQALGNLIDNACKYSPRGSPVALQVSRHHNEAVLGVEDSGIGIDPAEMGRVCEPFFRSAEARRSGVGGYGLGLAVASSMVRAFRGRIEVSSEPGRGIALYLATRKEKR